MMKVFLSIIAILVILFSGCSKTSSKITADTAKKITTTVEEEDGCIDE